MSDSEKLDLLLEIATRAEKNIGIFLDEARPILAELKPTVDKLMESPMIRMITGGKKK